MLREDDLIGILDNQNARADRLRQQITELQDNLRKLRDSGDRNAAATHQAEQEAAALARKTFAQMRRHWTGTKQADESALAEARSQMRELRLDLDRQLLELPDLQLRAQSAADSLAAARSQLLAHLEELHTFARQRREDLEALRRQ